MSSSDSEDDCYGNIAQKLQTIKSKYVGEKTDNVASNDITEVTKTSGKQGENSTKTEGSTSEIIVEDCNVTVNSTDNDEYTLDAIIANNTKSKPKRGRGGKRKSSDSSEASGLGTRTSRRKTNNSARGRTSPVTVPTPDIPPVEENTSTATTSRGGGSTTRGRGARGRNRRSTASPRGRARGRGRRRYFDMFEAFSSHRAVMDYPIYSVGNTDEYPDQCDNQALFSTKNTVNDDIEVIEDVDPLEDDNEEMSVKVYWQNLEIFKFKIRKYQKLTQIFDYFTEKEGVTNDKLLFTYNERILKIDDTPDSINYSIAKFIDGGVVNQNVTHLVKEKRKKDTNNGLKLKFQCQNMKKPFETTLRPEDKLALAMMKCAEHLETPLERLKFYFDGDLLSTATLARLAAKSYATALIAMALISFQLQHRNAAWRQIYNILGKNTPQDLELEGGECIDVKICS